MPDPGGRGSRCLVIILAAKPPPKVRYPRRHSLVRVIDDTQNDLVRLMAADFGFLPSGDYQTDFINWIHFRARRVPRLPRQVFISQEVNSHELRYPAIKKIRLALMIGEDIDPWLSKKTQKNKINYKYDMMFNNWQILHFHLGEIFQSQKLVSRTGPLLFVHITAKEATLLDVRPHGSWTTMDLLEIFLRTNPPGLERYEVRGVTPMRLSDEQYKNLRANHLNSAIEISGRAFIPGGGILASGHAARLYYYRDWFFNMIKKLQHDLSADVVEPYLKPAIYARLGVPIKLGAYYDDHGMALVDKNRNGLVLHQMKPLE